MWRTAVLVATLLAGALCQVPANDNTVKTRACQPPYNTFPFCSTTLSVHDRVLNLISLLKDTEKPVFLKSREDGGGSPGPPNNISRLGIPEYDWGLNCLHGSQTSCVTAGHTTYCPTSFPNPNALGASFNMSLVRAMGQVIGVETRALWLAGATEASPWSGWPHNGLDCWSPNINIARDPRWGRNQEVPSEDPYLTGQYAIAYTQGMQVGPDPRYIQVITTLKHWDAYSLEASDGYTRHTFNAIVSNQTLADTYFPAFKAGVIAGQAQGVMCSYNELNGIPTCASPLLRAVLRESWNFTGYVTSDTDAISDIWETHHYTATPQEAACAGLTHNCDINSGSIYFDYALSAVSQGLCTMADVDAALYNTLKLRFQLGLFDPIEDQPMWHVPLSAINTTAAQELNLLSTRESLVLLKNDADTLPFPKGKSVAVIGPHFEAQAAFVGNYLGQMCPESNTSMSCIPTLLDAMTKANKGGQTQGTLGCNVTGNDTSGFAAAVALAQASDYVLLALGIDETVEHEGADRTTIDLPGMQHQLAAAVLAVGKPTALVLLNGGAVAIAPEKASVPAIIEAFYPGFWGGKAIADTVFGDNDHLGGKMPFTIYQADYVNQISMTDMEMAPNIPPGSPGRTYKYFVGEPLYPFGYGLAYTTFALANVSAPATAVIRANVPGDVLTYTVRVTNTGKKTGDEVVMAFFSPTKLQNQQSAILRQLFGFQRVHLNPGGSQSVTFQVSRETLQLAISTGDLVATPGLFTLTFTNGVTQTLTFSVTMTGQETVLDAFPRHY